MMLPILTVMALMAAPGNPQSPAASRPPTAAEQQRFDEGTRALGAGDARGAEKAFRAGYDAGHDPAFLVHVGEAQEKAGAPAEAVETYRRYLREAPDASDRADIEQRIARLAPGAPAAPAQPPAGAAAATPAPPPAGATPVAPASPDAEKPGTAEEDSGWNR
ncbi:MAG: hypothetical protein ACJ8F1_08650, partial [Polyangia bacterium]